MKYTQHKQAILSHFLRLRQQNAELK